MNLFFPCFFFFDFDFISFVKLNKNWVNLINYSFEFIMDLYKVYFGCGCIVTNDEEVVTVGSIARLSTKEIIKC